GLKDAISKAKLAEAGGDDPVLDIGAAELEAEDLEAGIEATESIVPDFLGELVAGPFAIIGIAVAILVQESILIASEVQLPLKLQSNLDSVNSETPNLS